MLLRGKFYLTKYIDNLYQKNKKNIKSHLLEPVISIVCVGCSLDSHVYIRNKIIYLNKTLILTRLYYFPQTIKEKTITNLIHNLNKNILIHGIIAINPLPKHIRLNHIVTEIGKNKDVDGLNPTNFGNSIYGNKFFPVCVASSVFFFIKKIKKNIKGLHVVILGASPTVGTQILLFLVNKGLTVTICDKNTKNLKNYVKLADIIVTATGKIDLITSNLLKKSAVVIDVGIIIKNKVVIGDVSFLKHSGWLTPVPGGVGPITLLHLLKNIMKAYFINVDTLKIRKKKISTST